MIPSEQRATVLSFDNLMGSAGGVVTQPVLGRVADVYGYGASYIVAAGVQALALPFLVLARRETRRLRPDHRRRRRPAGGRVRSRWIDADASPKDVGICPIAGHDGAVKESIPPEALLAGYPDDMRRIAERLCAIVRRAVPEAIERVRPGWYLVGYDLSVGRRTTFFAFVTPESKHVHLGFKNGFLLDDPSGLLLGRGITKQARWFTFRPGDTIDAAVLTPFVLEAARIAGLSRPERQMLAFDLDARPDRPG